MDQKNKDDLEGEKEKVGRQKDYRPFIQQDEQDKRNFHDSSTAADFMTIDQRETMRELDESQLVEPPPPTAASTALVVKEDVHMPDVQVTTAARLPDVYSSKRKRGRPPRGGQAKTVLFPPIPKRKRAMDDEEDVCFICFDGGSLVLCDRRGCPKAYHPACIKRDEAFFQSKAKWNCGWHICSICEKASHYMCYTCTYSLCKGCTKGADYVCVRGNKGFCGTCKKTIMLIEKVSLGNVEQVQVDFDDKTSWEYLFKVYWVYLKDKLTLTVDELTNAKNPWNGDELPKPRNSGKRNGIVPQKDIVAGELFHANNEKVSCLENCSGNGEGAGTLSKRRKTNDQSDQSDQAKLFKEKNITVTEKSTVQKVTPLPEGRTWATKALLEFVGHMKDGDSSALSHSDVQALLLEYVKRNNLQEPGQKGQVVCDERLLNLFRKQRVGHLEMLKLLEYHFLTIEKPQPVGTVRATVAHALSSQLEGASSTIEKPQPVDTVRTTVAHALNSQLEGASSTIEKPQPVDTVRTTVAHALSSQLEGASSTIEKPQPVDTVRTTVAHALSSQLEGASSTIEKPQPVDTVRTTVAHALSSQLEGASSTIEKPQPVDTVRTTVAHALSSQLEGASSSDSRLVVVNDRTRKTHKRMNGKGSPVNPNPDEYAAIDAHNINLLYLTRNLMENLLDDAEDFDEKVVGSFVRIRISVGDQKQDVHRLVQVVGTCKADESYKVGSRTINTKLEILSLDKKEVISIDGISDQDFSEDECRRLRESIKCGLMKRLKVGEIEEKAMVLKPVKVSDCLEAEILRLNHLRDRASGKGRRKELRECVKKIELLKSPKERERRLLQIPSVHMDPRMAPSVHMDPRMAPSVHMDPRMGPSYVSKEDARERDDSKQGDHVRQNSPGVAIKGIELNSSPGEGDLNDIGHRALKTLAAASEQIRNVEMKFCEDPEASVQIHEAGNDSALSQGAGSYGLNSQNTSKNQLGGADSVTVDWSSPAPVTSESVPGVASSVIPPPLSSGSELSVGDFENEKLWHYQDPSGKIQGPFSMMQLRKWSEIKIFPDDFRVWRINKKQHDSILLTDALIGRFPKEPLQPQNSHLLSQEETVAYNDADKKWEHGLRQGTDVTCVDKKRADHDQKLLQNEVQNHGNSNDELAKSSGLASHSISWIKAADVPVTDDVQARSSLQVWEFPEDSKSGTGQSQICSSLPAPLSSGKSYEAPLFNERERDKDEKWSLKPCNADKDSHRTTSQTNAKHNDEKRSESEGQSSGENWRPQSLNSSTSGWDPNASFLSMLTSIESSEQNEKINFSNMPSAASMQANEDLKNQVAENKLCASSNVPVQDSGPPSWSTGSSLVIGGRQVPEVAVEWLGYSSTPAKRSVEQWDSNLVSASSLKPTERTVGHAAMPTDQLTLSSSTHPTIDASSWQPIVAEPNEFCSLVDESVSDLLAEVEAMESLGGLPSPTSKMRYDLELTPGSDDDCFSPVERFSPAPDPGKSDALSSTGDIQMPCQLSAVEESLRLSLMPSRPTIMDQQLAASQMSAQLAAINKPPHFSQIPRQGIVLNGPLRASQLPSQPPITEEPLRLWQRDVLDPQKSFSGRSSLSAEVDGDAKRSEVSVNQWDIRLEIRPLESTVKNRQSGSDIQPPTTSTVSQWEDGSNKQHPALTVDASRRSDKGNSNLNRGVPQGNATANMVWGSGHGSIQQQGSTNSGISTGSQGNWGSQPRYGGESRHSGQRDGGESRHSGQREHRNHSQSRDSGSGRDRSSWNSSRQAAYGVGNGGGSFKSPSKGQRVCKFYESGYCKKGASCSYWHP
ncbi:zinc finger CCCH domain-containing protein 44 [Euphorbia lathyris]|uniref:zinc finger CCCH domain-containing protein 44 n=1 Tax=Euphorbia lathyris TaxID=212925 RepID=UPI003313EBA8